MITCRLKAEGNIVELEDSDHPEKSPRKIKEATLEIIAENAIDSGSMLQGLKSNLDCLFK